MLYYKVILGERGVKVIRFEAIFPFQFNSFCYEVQNSQNNNPQSITLWTKSIIAAMEVDEGENFEEDQSNSEDGQSGNSEAEAREPIEDDETESCDEVMGKSKVKLSVKESKPGIVYLSTVPPGMNIRQIREYFAQFGEVNRSFLQPDKKGWKAKGKPKNQTFIEGWIEFRKRRHAKRAVATLNNNPVGGKKRKIYHDFLWNVKYLPGFQWVHLNERLAYERISMKQRLRTEISAVKRETEFFAKSIDLSKKLKKKGIIGKGSKNPTSDEKETTEGSTVFISTAAQPINLPEKKPPANPDRASFFKSLFVKGPKPNPKPKDPELKAKCNIRVLIRLINNRPGIRNQSERIVQQKHWNQNYNFLKQVRQCHSSSP